MSAVTHTPFDLRSIDHKKHQKFSPNLQKWMRKLSEPMRSTTKVYRDHEGFLWIGSISDDGWFYGSKLVRVLCNGTKEHRGAYPRKQFQRFAEVKNFWSEYRRIGRCAIDAEHQEHYLNSDSRFSVNGATRCCNWCGYRQKLEVREVIRKIESWVHEDEVP